MIEELIAHSLGQTSFEAWPSRCDLIAHRRARSLSLGPSMRLQFEDEWTVRHQVREVVRAERLTSAHEIRQEVQTYARWLPDGTQWKASLLIELPEAQQRERELPLLSGAAHEIYVAWAGASDCKRTYAVANDDLPDRHVGRPSAVHFLRFDLPLSLRKRILGGRSAIIGCAHDYYRWQRPIPDELLPLLRSDLETMETRPDFYGERRHVNFTSTYRI